MSGRSPSGTPSHCSKVVAYGSTVMTLSNLQNAQALFIIEDQGIGIPKADKPERHTVARVGCRRFNCRLSRFAPLPSSLPSFHV